MIRKRIKFIMIPLSGMKDRKMAFDIVLRKLAMTEWSPAKWGNHFSVLHLSVI